MILLRGERSLRQHGWWTGAGLSPFEGMITFTDAIQGNVGKYNGQCFRTLWLAWVAGVIFSEDSDYWTITEDRRERSGGLASRFSLTFDFEPLNERSCPAGLPLSRLPTPFRSSALPLLS